MSLLSSIDSLCNNLYIETGKKRTFTLIICVHYAFTLIHPHSKAQYRCVAGVTTQHLSLHQSQLLLNPRARLWGSERRSFISTDRRLSTEQAVDKTLGNHQTVTHMFKFLHAVLHGSLFLWWITLLLLSVRLVFWVFGDGAARRGGDVQDAARATEGEARLAAVIFPSFGLGAGMMGPLYRAWWRAWKVRRGLPPLTHYTPATSYSTRTNWPFSPNLSLFCKFLSAPLATVCLTDWLHSGFTEKLPPERCVSRGLKLYWIWLLIEQVQR